MAAASQIEGAIRGRHWTYLRGLVEIVKAMGGKILWLERGSVVSFPTDS